MMPLKDKSSLRARKAGREEPVLVPSPASALISYFFLSPAGTGPRTQLKAPAFVGVKDKVT